MDKTLNATVLAVDDDEDFCYGLKRIVTRAGYGFEAAPSIALAREAVKAGGVDLILLDVGLPDGNGLDLLPELKALASAPEVVIITGAGEPEGAELAILNGAWDYIEKTATARDIALTITRALQYRGERQRSASADQVTALNQEGIIGSSPRMKQAMDAVARAAACKANVLITGETGTGKEVFARAVHQNSARAGRDMVVVDCAALPETLAENLLFGHKKGVYTGARENREGLIRMADQGTLFLDEIGELPLNLQKTLLRVLQEKRFRPLGGDSEVNSDFRLIAATNRDLDQMVSQGRFRKDLLFRIRSLHIHLPALRERKDDIRKLARHYLDHFCEGQMLDFKGVSSDFFEVLDAYGWPGNVRELAHTMEHVVMAALGDPTVFPTHLPKPVRVAVVTSGLSRGRLPAQGTDRLLAGRAMPELAAYREMILETYEKKYMNDLILKTRSIQEACTVSGLSRSRLYALLKKHGVRSK